ncbi:hypothetical protein FDP41_007239 [Naegleria fowleri]|uniref:Ribosomal protein S18 n=1 Tax=Naegleria fowleri TaxID=5763 RepID=A0A6A5BGD5_NAEFO|nr:uncharacterized protein FDP41_008063 [Naegleria fowleri]XP_044558565.1 uncharacterized protein FDP41_007239 [Naegleria fowleri]KAF0973636.1 hypothetical protein FDP41_008063 [Naegleria fowleri]KAF0973852.1 hypothetical protein FDP41_007239 [Naegleria fowleri]CAG4717812.1 unnamed protein product [Naegleria fowleri]
MKRVILHRSLRSFNNKTQQQLLFPHHSSSTVAILLSSHHHHQQNFSTHPCSNEGVKQIELDQASKKKLANKKLSLKDIHKLIEENIARSRGGRANYDGSDVYQAATTSKKAKNISPEAPFQANSPDSPQGNTWYDYYRYIERADSDVFNHYLKTPVNANTSGWLYNKPPTSHMEFMSAVNQFTEVAQDWREGKLAGDDIQHRKMMEYQLHQLPQFKTRPPDPFANNQHYIEKISYKNPNLLLKFVSQTGRIIPKRFTGVRRRTHKKIQDEVKKARHLGLLSFTGASLEQGNLLNQIEIPYISNEFNLKNRTEIHLTKSQQVDNTKFYLDNLSKNISTSGTIEWIPPEKNRNPRAGIKQQKAQLEGHLKSQVEKKKALIRKLRVENEILKQQEQQQQ